MGTNTGKPGFVIEPEDVVDESLSGVYNYDVGAPDRPIDPSYPDTSVADKKGDIKIADTSGHDLSEKTRVTLSSYLGKKTQKNYYRIDPKTSDVTLNLSDEKDSTARLSPVPEPESEYKWFSSGKKTDFPRESPGLKGWSPGNQPIDPEPELSALLKKGKLSRSPGEFDGNTLLPEAKGPAERKIENYTRAVLSNNRFTSSARYVPKSGTTDESSASDVESAAASGGYNPTFHHPLHGEFTAGKLANIGVELMLRASQDSFGKNPTSDSAIGGAALPSANQLGITKIEAVKLQAADVIKSLTNDEVPESQYSSLAGSWGSLNNVHDQFSGMSSAGMVALTAALQTSVLGIVYGISKTVTLLSPQPESAVTLEKKLGSSGRKQWNVLAQTINPYEKCVEKGVAVFFGYDDLKLGQQVDKLVLSAGYYAILCRAIIRSSAAFFGSVEKSLAQSSKLDAAKSLVTSAESLLASKAISALNMFATIGDIAFESERSDVRTTKASNAATANSSVVHGSLSSLTNRSSNSLYMLPARIANLNRGVSGLGEQISTDFQDRGKASIEYSSTARLSPGLVGVAEKALDVAYVPFYFHDLRTNEIISFHAFLENISDSYSANYESTPGFGRVEPIKAYKDTARKIGVSFYVVATDALDFEHMWAKINKLTTFVYPQYTEGRRVRTGNSEFVQPFSQMQSTSPLIRLRLGNLFRSNYTKFALARLFGATLSGTKFNDVNDPTLNVEEQKTGTNDSLSRYIDSQKNAVGTVWRSLVNDSVLVKIETVTGDNVVCSVVDNGSYVNSLESTLIAFKKDQLGATDATLRQYEATRTSRDISSDKSQRVQEFFSNEGKNAIVKSFSSTAGKGLAGFIDQLDFDWTGGNKMVWDIDEDKKVPMMCKVTIGFTPVHDISPGIDSQGYNRAPLYPVGIHAHNVKEK